MVYRYVLTGHIVCCIYSKLSEHVLKSISSPLEVLVTAPGAASPLQRYAEERPFGQGRLCYELHGLHVLATKSGFRGLSACVLDVGTRENSAGHSD
jgi:hypothetical protein